MIHTWRRHLSCWLCLAMLFSLFPGIVVHAAEEDYSLSDYIELTGVHTQTETVITGAYNYKADSVGPLVYFAPGFDGAVTLKDVTIDLGTYAGTPIQIAPNVTAVIYLEGTNIIVNDRQNILASTVGSIKVPATSSLIIRGNGSLKAYGYNSAAIGSGHQEGDSGSITIEDRVSIFAYGESVGAAIGGGGSLSSAIPGGSATSIMIGGYAKVFAMGDYGAAIGGGGSKKLESSEDGKSFAGGAGGGIIINEHAVVEAVSGYGVNAVDGNGAAIGGGFGTGTGGTGGTITIGGDAKVTATTRGNGAAIGGGCGNEEGGSGGIITIEERAAVMALGAHGAAIGGGSSSKQGGAAGAISISSPGVRATSEGSESGTGATIGSGSVFTGQNGEPIKGLKTISYSGNGSQGVSAVVSELYVTADSITLPSAIWLSFYEEDFAALKEETISWVTTAAGKQGTEQGRTYPLSGTDVTFYVLNTTAPTITDIRINGDELSQLQPTAGTIVIRFSEGMDADQAVISLAYGGMGHELASIEYDWTSDTSASGIAYSILSLDYSGLPFDTMVSLAFAGFCNLAGNDLDLQDVQYSFTTEARGKQPTPVISIAYEKGELTGFDGGIYSAALNLLQIQGNETKKTTIASTIAISDAWFGKTISIVYHGNENHADSDWLHLNIPARPVAPTVYNKVDRTGIVNVTCAESDILDNGKIEIENTTARMVYRPQTNTGEWREENWETIPGNSITGLAYGFYQVAFAGDNDNQKFRSQPLTVYIGKGESDIRPVLTGAAPVFDSLVVGYAQPAAQQIIITNSGTTEAVIDTAYVELAHNNPGFECPVDVVPDYISIPAGESSNVLTVRPKAGLSVGTHKAILNVPYTDVNGYSAKLQVELTFVVLPQNLSIVSVLPAANATEIEPGGQVYIVFSEVMDAAYGTLRLASSNETEELAGAWSDGKRYTAEYSGLKLSTSYDIRLSDFRDTYGRSISVSDTTYSFTTRAGAVILTADDIDFGEAYQGYSQPAARPLVIRNSGEVDTTITQITLRENSAFHLRAGTDFQVPAGGSNTEWIIQPKENLNIQSYEETVTIFYGNDSQTTAAIRFTVRAASVPAAPRIPTATAGNGSASVSFSAPAEDGGAPISGYRVTASPGGLTAEGTASPIVINGLANGTAYTFTVQALNAKGYGAASEPSNAVTPSGGGYIPPSNPNPPGGNSSSGSGSGSTSTGSGSTTTSTVEVGGLDLRVSSQANGERLSVTMTSQQRQELIASQGESIILDLSDYNAAHDNDSSVSTVRLSKSDFRALAEADKALILVNDQGGLIIDAEAMGSLAATAGKISGSNLDITLKQISSDNLPNNMSKEQKEAAEALLAEGALIFDVDVLIGNRSLGEFDGSIEVDVAYELKEGETAEGMSVWYLNDAGELEELPCTYENGRIHFALPGHFSYYVLGYSQAKADAAAAAAAKPEPKPDDGKTPEPQPVGIEPIILTIGSSVVRQGEGTLSAPPVAPQIINSRTMLPFRYLIQTLLGGDVDWDNATRTVTAEINGVTFQMTIDDTTIVISGEAIAFDQAPVIVDDYTLVPLRVFEKAVESITWDEAARTVTIMPAENNG